MGGRHVAKRSSDPRVASASVSDLDTTIVGDVTVRRSKMDGEFVSLKQQPMTSRAVCYRIELAVAKTWMPG